MVVVLKKPMVVQSADTSIPRSQYVTENEDHVTPYPEENCVRVKLIHYCVQLSSKLKPSFRNASSASGEVVSGGAEAWQPQSILLSHQWQRLHIFPFDMVLLLFVV